MVNVLARGKRKKAKREAHKAAVEARKAFRDAGVAARDLGLALRAQARAAGLDERAEDLAHRAEDYARKVMAADMTKELSRRAERYAHKMMEADTTKEALAQARDVANRITASDAAKKTMTGARHASDEGMERLGSWLTSGKRAKALRVQPKKRRMPSWIALAVGMGLGYVIAQMTARRSDEWPQAPADFGSLADAGTMDSSDLLVEEIRARLNADPRTASLPDLSINVAEGTVFVRGSIPADADESAIREVVSAVPGVSGIDVQVNASA